MRNNNAYDAVIRNLPNDWRKGFEDGRYRIGCGGTEEPVYRNGKWYLLIWDTQDKRHLNYCYADDIFYEI